MMATRNVFAVASESADNIQNFLQYYKNIIAEADLSALPIGDQPRPALEREIRPRPLKHHQETVAKSDQEQDMHRQPRRPGNKSPELHAPDIYNAKGAPHCGQVALVVIVEGSVCRAERGGAI